MIQALSANHTPGPISVPGSRTSSLFVLPPCRSRGFYTAPFETGFDVEEVGAGTALNLKYYSKSTSNLHLVLWANGIWVKKSQALARRRKDQTRSSFHIALNWLQGKARSVIRTFVIYSRTAREGTMGSFMRNHCGTRKKADEVCLGVPWSAFGSVLRNT